MSSSGPLLPETWFSPAGCSCVPICVTVTLFTLSLAVHHHGLNLRSFLCKQRVLASRQVGMGHQTAPQPTASSFSASVQETFYHSCDTAVLTLQHFSSKIDQTFYCTLVFALSIGALQVTVFTDVPTANVALFMIQKTTCHFLFSDC